MDQRIAMCMFVGLCCTTQACHPTWTPSTKHTTVEPWDLEEAQPETQEAQPEIRKSKTDEAYSVVVWPVGVFRKLDAGKLYQMRVTVQPSDGHASLSIAEELSGGVGPQMRASAWIAAAVAARLVGRPLSSLSIHIDLGGKVDGPSAGALMTAAIMAAITKTPVRPDVVISASINPDGSLGYVGSLPSKLRVAAKNLKRVFGVFREQRNVDEGNHRVDLADLASDSDLQLRWLSTAYDAFALLTGKAYLPARSPTDRNIFNTAPTSIYRDATRHFAAEAEEAFNHSKQTLTRDVLDLLSPHARKCGDALKRIAARKDEKCAACTTAFARQVSSMCRGINAVADVLNRHPEGTLWQRLTEVANSPDLVEYQKTVLRRVGVMSKRSVARAMYAFEGVVRSLLAETLAKRLLRRFDPNRPMPQAKNTEQTAAPTPQVREAMLKTVTTSLVLAYGHILSALGIDALLKKEDTHDAMLTAAAIRRVANALAVEAEALTTYAQSYLAKIPNMTRSKQYRRVKRARQLLAIARRAIDVQKSRWGHLALLAASRAAIDDVTPVLLMLHSSGDIRTCRNSLPYAERMARKRAASAKKMHGFVSPAATFYYLRAQGQREQNNCWAAWHLFDAATRASEIVRDLQSGI